MYGYFCIRFTDFVSKDKSLLDYTNLFSLNEYEKNDKTILEYFQELKILRWKKSIVLFVISIENLKTLKFQTFSKKSISSFYHLQ